MEIKLAIKNFRKELVLTQMEMAKRLGVSYTTINRWENGRAIPDTSATRKLLSLLQSEPTSARCRKMVKDALGKARAASIYQEKSRLSEVSAESIYQLVDASHNEVYVSDLVTDELLYVNRQAEKTFHRRFDPTRHQKCYEFVANRTSPCENCSKRNLPEHGFSDVHVYSDLLHKYFHINGRKILWNGVPAHAQYLTDVTYAMEEPSGTNRVLDHVKVGLGTFNVYKDGQIELSVLNNGYYAMIGSTREERLAYAKFTAMQALSEKDRACVIRQMQAAAKTQSNFDISYRAIMPDGSEKWINMRGCFLMQDTTKATYICVFLDIDRFMK